VCKLMDNDLLQDCFVVFKGGNSSKNFFENFSSFLFSDYNGVCFKKLRHWCYIVFRDFLTLSSKFVTYLVLFLQSALEMPSKKNFHAIIQKREKFWENFFLAFCAFSKLLCFWMIYLAHTAPVNFSDSCRAYCQLRGHER